MRIQRTSQIVTAAIAGLSAAAIACALVSREYRITQEQAYEARRKMFNYTEQLAQGSDRLTAAVRAYAATGERRHYDAFRKELNEDRNRDVAIEGLRQLDLTRDERELISRAKRNSDDLVRLEEQAFAAVAANDSARAVQIAFGPEYEAAKASIMGAIAEAREALQLRLTDRADTLAARARVLTNVALALLIVNAAAMVAALLLFYRRRVVNPLAHLNQSLRDLVAARPGARIGYLDDKSEVGEVARSMESYRVKVDEAERQRWVKTSVAEIADALQGAEQPDEFGRQLLSRLVPLLGGGWGAFHLFREQGGRFEFAAGYGVERRAGQDGGERGFAPGEGVAGQAAVERKAIVLSNLPPDYVRITSGLGGAPPHTLVAVPVATPDRVLAVVEVASFGELTDPQRALLSEAADTVALKLDVLQRNVRTRELLEQVKSSEQRLRETEQFFRGVLELAPDGLMVVDADGVIRLANAQCEQLFGFRREELIGQKVEMLVPEEFRAGHPAKRESYHRSPAVREMGAGMELRGLRKDGSQFAVEIGLSPLHAKEGERAMVAASVRDITDRKRIDAELRKAMQRAEEATRAKSAFLANMSHEIRTPMNGIIGMTELALDTELSAEQRDYLNTVKWSADALLMLINDILDFSKVEAGRVELDPVEFLLRDAIGDTLNPLALRASSKGLELAYDIAPDVPDALVADVYRLRQVIVNLVGNAIKFTEKGEVVVSIRAVESNGDERLLEIAVRDTGIGIPPAAAAKLFQPFEQADAATTRKYGGTGLGLAISKQLVELMGGRLRLESEPGRGSTFVFTTRVRVGAARSTAGPEDAARLLGDVTVLVVDDNDTNRRILETMLRHWGLRTVSADAGAKALAVLDRSASAGQPVSLVITDLHMPEMDGFDLTAAIRRHPSLSSVPVFLLTSSASPGDQKRSEELHIAARLLKPVKQSLLLDNVMRVMAGPAVDAAGPSGAAAAPAAVEATAPDGSGEPAQPLRVLLAEDNPVNIKFALKVLERAGHQVTVAHNGREAVEHWQAAPFDVVLMDVQMPEMDGLDATRTIRRMEQGRDGRVPIIAMTANAMAGDREMCLGAGMDGYVAKPVKKESLLAELGRVVAKGGANVARV